VDVVFGAVDALLLPAMPHSAPLYADIEAALSGSSDLSFTLGKFTRSFNYLGLPSIAVPHGSDRSGLPLAFQIVGPPFEEARILRIAYTFEKEVPPQFPQFTPIRENRKERELT
jgi:Asp-tRNA(Asn)/Glu-tRNA(Gln) amidotransferase A subunit family amidase